MELTRIGRYEVSSGPIGGGMGSVYVAEDPALGRRVAVKVLHKHLTSDYGFSERFQREARIMGRLSHPNIVRVYEAGETEMGPYLAMEWIDGSNLDDCIGRGEYRALGDALAVVRQLCEALDYAHREGVIHRDLKPANVMVKPDGQAVLMDFGVAKLDNSNLTQTGTAIGTPQYMSPEQCKGATVDYRSDIYSLAVIVYEMLSGTRPFDSPNVLSIIGRQINDVPPPITSRVPGIAGHVEAAICKALSKNPNHRQQSAMDFYNDLMYGPRQQEIATAPPTPRVAGQCNKRQRTLLLLMAFTIVALLALLFVAAAEMSGVPVVGINGASKGSDRSIASVSHQLACTYTARGCLGKTRSRLTVDRIRS